MEPILLTLALILGVAALVYIVFFVRTLLQVAEAGPKLRTFTRGLVVATGLIAGLGVIAALLLPAPLSDWGAVITGADLTFLLLALAAEGFSIGFRQMEEDGVGYLRFFQLGSSILLTLAIAPAFFAFVTYLTRLA